MNIMKRDREWEEGMEKKWDLQREGMRLLDLIAAEFKSDPMSVQCFDARIVKRAIEVSAAFRALPDDVIGEISPTARMR